jgi:hypothetical protein
MAVWPNNYRTGAGVNPYRYLGQAGLYADLAVNGVNIHASLAKTASLPEGAAPHGAWVWPRTAGGMSSQMEIAAVATSLNLSLGGQMASNRSWLAFSESASLSLIVKLEGDMSMTLDFPAAVLTAVAALAGNFTAGLDFQNALLALLTPLEGQFTITFSHDAHVDAYLSMSGDFGPVSTTATPAQIAAAVWADPKGAALDELHKLQGLDAANPMTVSATTRTVDTITLNITTGGGGDVTVTRQP